MGLESAGAGLRNMVQSVVQTVAQLVGVALNVASVHTTGGIVGANAGTADLGTRAAGNTALWLGVTPTVSNYAISSSSAGDTTLNATSGQSVTFAVNNGVTGSFGATGLTIGAGGGFNLAGTGSFQVPNTDSSGTPGNATVNQPSGRSAIAAAASSCVVSNSLVGTGSRVFISPRQRDATGLLPAVTTVANGSFTVTTSAGCTGNLTFDWWVLS